MRSLYKSLLKWESDTMLNDHVNFGSGQVVFNDFDIKKGYFKLVIIKDREWLNPIFVWKTKNIKQLYSDMNEAVSKIEILVK